LTKTISSQALQNLIEDKQEFALLDIRDLADFVKGHLWLSINVPHTSIQDRVSSFVPRPDTRIILIDQDQTLAIKVAERLQSSGYSNLEVLPGGFDQWRQSGLPVITGDYVLAHAFGMYVNQVLATPSISANRLMQKLAAREDILIIDSRDPRDFQNSTLPGAKNVPIAEMVHRVPDMVDDESTQVVVHCGGVTRGVLGAQTLIDANFPNRIMWLVDGTGGWCMAGGELRRGETEPAKPPSDKATAYALKTALNLARQLNLTYLEPDDLEDWRRGNRQRTCYLIDIRSRDEFLAGHYPNAMNVPGGELVGMTQDHIATYHARLCLIGDTLSARVEITADWMLKNGWEDVVILRNWEHRYETEVTASPGDVTHADESTSKPADQPETAPMSQYQASIDNRQNIFKCFMRDHPYRFNLTASKLASDR
jgi:rhodanese-related sulfurtransferase